MQSADFLLKTCLMPFYKSEFVLFDSSGAGGSFLVGPGGLFTRHKGGLMYVAAAKPVLDLFTVSQCRGKGERGNELFHFNFNLSE